MRREILHKDAINGFGHVSVEERIQNSKMFWLFVERGEHCGTLLESFKRKAESYRAVISIGLAKHKGV